MRRNPMIWSTTAAIIFCVAASAGTAFAQDGILALRITPKQAYVFIDDTSFGYGEGLFRLPAGEHTLTLYNYGYKTLSEKFTIHERRKTGLQLTLEARPGTVSGPWGRIQIEGPSGALVLLNGKTMDFFVGHVDEFNHDIIWKQELLVPPGTHQITLLGEGDHQEIWSGSVTVQADQRVIVYVNKNGEQKTESWPRGKALGSVPRFHAGLASATVAVAAPKAQLTASQGQVNCGESAKLTWSSEDAGKVEISGLGTVPLQGEQAVQPKGPTTYEVKATGPGGTATATAATSANPAIQASLTMSPAEVRYHRVADKVQEQGTATISWSATNADAISLDPGGNVAASGSTTIQPTPKKGDMGPVDETLTYTLRATNACGGAETRTATLHIVGSIEPPPQAAVTETTLEVKLSLNSIYFPTALPTKADPRGGLVPSQQARLKDLADNFQQYLKFRPEAHLILQAHADQRGSVAANKVLSERRAERVKSSLLELGIPESDIEMKAFGSEQNLDAASVRQLTEQNPNLTPEERARVLKDLPTFLLANNRRVDIVLSTTGQQSARYFPLNSQDLEVLIGKTPKARRSVKKAAPRAAKPAAKTAAKKK